MCVVYTVSVYNHFNVCYKNQIHIEKPKKKTVNEKQQLSRNLWPTLNSTRDIILLLFCSFLRIFTQKKKISKN